MKTIAIIAVLVGAYFVCRESEILSIFAPLIGFALVPVIGAIAES